MRLFLAGLFTVVFVVIIETKTSAQVNISLNDIAKIHFIDASGYLGGYYSNEYELLRENGQWKTYQTHEKYSRLNPRARDIKKIKEYKDSAEYRFIKIVPEDSVKLFLKTLRAVKSNFSAADLKVSIPEITRQIDTAFLKKENRKHIKLFNSFFNTPSKLNHWLDTLQTDSWTDDYPTAVIEILKNNGDTTKILTHIQLDYMLPWTVNGAPDYDVNINRFFITATNLSSHRMSGKYLSYHLYSYVNYFRANDAFERLRWQEAVPENFKYIKQHFDILSASRFNESSGYTFHPNALNAHIHVVGRLNIKNRSSLEALTRCAEDTLRVFLKKGGFIIDSCLAKPGCIITFVNEFGKASRYYPEVLDNYLKEFNKYDLQPFTVKSGNRKEDYWIGLPNGNFVLAYTNDYAVGMAPQFIKKGNYTGRKFVFMAFAPDGKLIAEGE